MDYLLSRFTRQQNETLDAFVDLAADAAESVIAEGGEKSMAKFTLSRPGLPNRGRMRIYENLFIVKPDATEEEIDQLVEPDEQERLDLPAAPSTRSRSGANAGAISSGGEASRRSLCVDAVYGRVADREGV